MFQRKTNLKFSEGCTMDKHYLIKTTMTSIAIGTVVFFLQGVIPLKSVQDVEIKRKNPVREIETITLADTLIFHRNPENIFVDARERNYYDYAHVASAVNITPADIESNIVSAKILKKLKAAPNVVVYDISSSADKARQVAKLLASKGIDNVKIYLDGWTQWKACQLSIESAHTATAVAATAGKETQP